MTSVRLLRFILGVLALLLVLFLCSCATGSNDGGARTNDSSVAGNRGRFRLILAGAEARDSAVVVNDFYVDQALRAALDSIPAAEYLTLNIRDSLADAAIAGGGKGIELSEMGKLLKLDGAVYTRAQRFGSVLAIESRILNPATGKPIFRDLSFSIIRYRDTSGTMLLGPTLYDGVRKSMARFFGVPHRVDAPVATEPYIVGNVVIPRDPVLGQISTNRVKISTEGVKALGELALIQYPELVTFDYEARAQVYQSVNIAGVEDFMPMRDQERRALFAVGVNRYVSGSVLPLGSDSVQLRLELRYVLDPSRDSLIDYEAATLSRAKFQTTTAVEDVVISLIDLAEPLFMRETLRIREEYQSYLGTRQQQ